MTFQRTTSTYSQDLPVGKVGDFVSTDDNRDTELRTNDDPRAKQTEDITVSTAANNTDYTVTIEGVDITYTSGGSASKASIAEGLKDQINQEPQVNGVVEATDDNTDTVTVTALMGGTGFTITESDSNLTLTQTTANADADPVSFGRALIHDGYNPDLAKLADNSGFTARQLNVTVDTVTNSADYKLSLEVEGVVYEVSITSDASATEDEIINSLQTEISNLSESKITATANTGASPSQLEITPDTAGFTEFKLNSWTQNLASSVANAGDDLNDKFVGLAIRTAEEGNQYPPRSQMTVAKEGEVFVKTENSVSAGDDVYVRLSSHSGNDVLGIFRSGYQTGTVKLDGAKFKENLDTDKAILEL